jgi:transcriptional regulator with XRE-family HTH domain
MDPVEKVLKLIDVGQRLRELRDEREISMRALARRSGLSANALSMIERGLTSPSVSTLVKLAAALEVPIIAFFRREHQREKVVFCKATERTQVPIVRGLWEGLGGERFTGHMEAFRLTLEAGGSSGPYGMLHSGHEFVFCTGGNLDYEVDGRHYSMEEGDSLIFAAQMTHRWSNPGPGQAIAVIVLSSFEDTERPSEFHLASRDPVNDLAEHKPMNNEEANE